MPDTEEQLAEAVKSAVRVLNRALMAATKGGLEVTIDSHTSNNIAVMNHVIVTAKITKEL